MDKVNCALYSFRNELNLRALICPSMQTNGRRPLAFDGQASNAVRSGAGTCSRSTFSTSTSVVKNVKGTGDPEGIIDAIGRRRSAWRDDAEEGCLSLFGASSGMRSAGSP